MQWITREHPKIDRVACPWLITRFIDPQAEFLFAPLFPDDHELLARGFVIYDALYAWLQHAKRRVPASV